MAFLISCAILGIAYLIHLLRRGPDGGSFLESIDVTISKNALNKEIKGYENAYARYLLGAGCNAICNELHVYWNAYNISQRMKLRNPMDSAWYAYDAQRIIRDRNRTRDIKYYIFDGDRWAFIWNMGYTLNRLHPDKVSDEAFSFVDRMDPNIQDEYIAVACHDLSIGRLCSKDFLRIYADRTGHPYANPSDDEHAQLHRYWEHRSGVAQKRVMYVRELCKAIYPGKPMENARYELTRLIGAPEIAFAPTPYGDGTPTYRQAEAAAKRAMELISANSGFFDSNPNIAKPALMLLSSVVEEFRNPAVPIDVPVFIPEPVKPADPGQDDWLTVPDFDNQRCQDPQLAMLLDWQCPTESEQRLMEDVVFCSKKNAAFSLIVGKAWREYRIHMLLAQKNGIATRRTLEDRIRLNCPGVMQLYDRLSHDPRWIAGREVIREVCDVDPFRNKELIELANEYNDLCDQYREHPLQLTQSQKADVEDGIAAYFTKKRPALMYEYNIRRIAESE